MNKFSQIMHDRRFEIRRKDGEWQVRSYRQDGAWKEYDLGVITFSSQERAEAFVKNLADYIKRTEDDDAGC